MINVDNTYVRIYYYLTTNYYFTMKIYKDNKIKISKVPSHL